MSPEYNRNTKEVDATETMIARTAERSDLKPDHVAGDVADGTAEMLGGQFRQQLRKHVT